MAIFSEQWKVDLGPFGNKLDLSRKQQGLQIKQQQITETTGKEKHALAAFFSEQYLADWNQRSSTAKWQQWMT